MMQDTGALKNQAFSMHQVQGDRCLEDWGVRIWSEYIVLKIHVQLLETIRDKHKVSFVQKLITILPWVLVT